MLDFLGSASGIVSHTGVHGPMGVHSQRPAASNGFSRSSFFATTAALVGLIVAWLLLMPFDPIMPGIGFDQSWKYALNEAVSRGSVFGRDVIYSFGPYASVYTRMYSPATDTMMMLASSLLATGFCIALGLAIPRRRLFLAVIFPLLLAISHSRAYATDSFFFSTRLRCFSLFAGCCCLRTQHSAYARARRRFSGSAFPQLPRRSSR